MKYDIFFIDLDQTLLDFDRSERQALKDALQAVGIKFKSQMHSAYHNINKRLWHKFERGEIERDEIFNRRFKDLFAEIQKPYDERIDRLYFENLSENAHILKGAKRFLSKLKKYGRVYALTNGRTHTQERRIKKSGIEKYFDDIFISEQTEHKKPDIEFFEYAASKVEGFEKKRTVMIGDSLSSDIAGGNNFGIDTVYFSKESPKKDLVVPTYFARTYKEILVFLKSI